MGDFIHLHVHTSYSFLDGYCKPDKLAKQASALGMNAIAMTDHNHIGGAYEFQQACQAEGIKPLFGCELYYTDRIDTMMMSADDRHKQAAELALSEGVIDEAQCDAIIKKKKGVKGIKTIRDAIKPFEYDMHDYHILFLAMNQNGWNNLVKMQSEAAAKCTFNGRFHVDNELIRKYSDDLIMTTACIGSRPARLINSNQLDEAERLIKEWHDIFGDRLYLEIQPLPLDKQLNVNQIYMYWAKKYDISLIATNDVHYLTKEDHNDHDTLLCIGTGKKKSDTDRMKYSNDFWLRTYDEMITAFTLQTRMIENLNPMFDDNMQQDYMSSVASAMHNSTVIANRIADSIHLGADHDLLPHYKVPNGQDAKQYLLCLAYNGLYRYAKEQEMNGKIIAIYEKRLRHELDVIFKRNFEEYMLIVREYVNWANENGCVTGPGRGSAGGSLLLFLIGVTKMIDPIKYDLLFERFLTIDRHGYPD